MDTKTLFLISLIGLVNCGPIIPLDHKVVILTYHAIESSPSSKYTRATSDFLADLGYLQSKYQFMTIEELYSRIEKKESIERPTIILNFDDGLLEHYTIAYPELLKRGLVADFLVPTANVGHSGHLTWDQIIEMQNAGLNMNSHSYHHIHLADKLDNESDAAYKTRIEYEMQRSFDDFKDHGIYTYIMALPFGSGNDIVVQAGLDAGYKIIRGTGNAAEMIPGYTITNLTYYGVLDSSDVQALDL